MKQVNLSEMDIHLLKNMYDYVIELPSGIENVQRRCKFNDTQIYDTLKSVKNKLKDE